MAADDTVPSRLYFHCADVILALIDWRVEGQGPLRPTPDDMYLATGDLDSVYERALAAGAREVSSIEATSVGRAILLLPRSRRQSALLCRRLDVVPRQGCRLVVSGAVSPVRQTTRPGREQSHRPQLLSGLRPAQI